MPAALPLKLCRGRWRCGDAGVRAQKVDGVGGDCLGGDGVEVGDGDGGGPGSNADGGGPGSNADGGARGGDAEAVAMLSGVLPSFDA
jgi:hypothetical protein